MRISWWVEGVPHAIAGAAVWVAVVWDGVTCARGGTPFWRKRVGTQKVCSPSPPLPSDLVHALCRLMQWPLSSQTRLAVRRECVAQDIQVGSGAGVEDIMGGSKYVVNMSLIHSLTRSHQLYLPLWDTTRGYLKVARNTTCIRSRIYDFW
ncbi:hypothetical protein FPV67DRAFT_209666 [Lyophyllum atratum]|nr:hypothetical protein FPV67DRAFT_209666 [Lyophyllum atratum]